MLNKSDAERVTKALEYYAHMEAGQTQAPDLCTDEDYNEWHLAQRIRKEARSTKWRVFEKLEPGPFVRMKPNPKAKYQDVDDVVEDKPYEVGTVDLHIQVSGPTDMTVRQVQDFCIEAISDWSGDILDWRRCREGGVMSRSGYTDDFGDDDPLAMGRYRQAVANAINGKRGQSMLRELLSALDAMPEKALASESFVTEDGEFCTLGVLGKARGIPIETLDPDDPDAVAAAFGVAPSMVREIVYENDEGQSGYHFVEVEICGPVRPYWPDYGDHKAVVRVDDENLPGKRWRYMRAWVASHLKEKP